MIASVFYVQAGQANIKELTHKYKPAGICAVASEGWKIEVYGLELLCLKIDGITYCAKEEK